MHDDLGADVPLTGPAQRVVSLVPSLTEAIAASAPDVLVGATDWCTHPADLSVARVRGTKNPDLAAIRALSPDLVVVNQEENRELDVRRLRDAGVAVWVTRIETVEESLASMSRLFSSALGLDDPPWLTRARSLWSTPAPPRLRVAVPIWRDPWMVVGSPTYTDDLLARAGLVNVLADPRPSADPSAGRYPTVTPAEIDDRRRGRRAAAGRALRLHRVRRTRGAADADAAGVGAAADLVRPGDGRGTRDAD